MSMRLTILVLLALVLILMHSAFATNGMNLEGYGPIANGVGGASMAYDNGTAAMMNNPATLSLMQQGWRLDLALGMLGPNVDATVATPAGNLTASSEANAFFMPALGLVRKQDKFVYGLGVFGQGGMGTEYSKTSWLADPSQGTNTALAEGLVNRSEVSVGRAMGTFGYKVNDKLSIGVTADLVWAGIDLQMAISEAQFRDLANPQAQNKGTASGTLVSVFGTLYEPFGGTGISKLYHAYFDFSNDNDFTGQAMGFGFAGKIGAVYKATPELTVGATFHSPTMLADLETDDAALSMGVNIDPGIFQGQPGQPYQDMIIPITGKIVIEDFQWPATFGAGVAYQAMDNLMLAGDVKYIMWSQVMEDFKMTFTADNTPQNGGFGGLVMNASLRQEWEDQAVFAVGGAYKPIQPLTLRTGFNYGKNPVPNIYLNALFPAIVETHATFGAGYDFGQGSQINAGATVGFNKEATNSGSCLPCEPCSDSVPPPVKSSHSQLNWMVMFSHNF
jgi:long-chain fatty acid transport protein